MQSVRTDSQGAGRGVIAGIPIWVRVSVIIALVLVGVLIGSMVLGGTAIAGHGGGGHTAQTDHGAGHSGPATPSDHGGQARTH